MELIGPYFISHVFSTFYASDLPEARQKPKIIRRSLLQKKKNKFMISWIILAAGRQVSAKDNLNQIQQSKVVEKRYTKHLRVHDNP
jgi:hypothetical protein